MIFLDRIYMINMIRKRALLLKKNEHIYLIYSDLYLCEYFISDPVNLVDPVKIYFT